ncbi:unnamed protein product [Didymodactylos carnosus]|uniref:Uncharacterized protein n=1 Tax=Didymodactylos carnosus TaxID=1234261 RepID=A0A815BYH6_9BILA|nr:unnamed protein product [Didymodactylos carnosus]CAF4067316.1 unnamed protein product [Didymodactylos carnosus]
MPSASAVTQLVKYMNEHPARRASPPQRIVELIDHLSSSTTQDPVLTPSLTQHSLLEDYSYHEAISARTPVASPPAPLIASLIVQSEGLIVNSSNSQSSIAPPPKNNQVTSVSGVAGRQVKHDTPEPMEDTMNQDLEVPVPQIWFGQSKCVHEFSYTLINLNYSRRYYQNYVLRRQPLPPPPRHQKHQDN